MLLKTSNGLFMLIVSHLPVSLLLFLSLGLFYLETSQHQNQTSSYHSCLCLNNINAYIVILNLEFVFDLEKRENQSLRRTWRQWLRW